MDHPESTIYRFDIHHIMPGDDPETEVVMCAETAASAFGYAAYLATTNPGHRLAVFETTASGEYECLGGVHLSTNDGAFRVVDSGREFVFERKPDAPSVDEVQARTGARLALRGRR